MREHCTPTELGVLTNVYTSSPATTLDSVTRPTRTSRPLACGQGGHAGRPFLLLLARSTRSLLTYCVRIVGRAGSYIDWPVTDLLLVLGIYRAVDEFERTRSAQRA